MATSWTTATLEASSVSARGTVGTGLATLLRCQAPGAIVYINNQDATAANVVTVAVNDTPTAGANGINIAGKTEGDSVREIRMVRGDVLYAIAAADRAVDIIAVPAY